MGTLLSVLLHSIVNGHISLSCMRVHAARRKRTATLVLREREADVALQFAVGSVSQTIYRETKDTTYPVKPDNWFEILPVSMSARGDFRPGPADKSDS